jgi:AcrR family transcriptional regulator
MTYRDGRLTKIVIMSRRNQSTNKHVKVQLKYRWLSAMQSRAKLALGAAARRGYNPVRAPNCFLGARIKAIVGDEVAPYMSDKTKGTKKQEERSTYHHGDLPDALRRAVLELIAEEGISNVSMAAISRRAGVSTAAPYRHFKSRDELLTSIACDIYAKLFQRQQQKAKQCKTAADQIAAIVREYFVFARDEPAAFELLFNTNLRLTRPEFDATNSASNAEMQRMISELGNASDELRERLLLGIRAVIYGTEQMMNERPEDLDTHDFGGVAVSAIDLLIAGFDAERRRKRS